MPLPRLIQTYLAKGDYPSLEDHWLSRVAEEPGDLDYFVGVARALAGSGEEGRARFLLELCDDQLRARGWWGERLALLRRVGHLLLDPGSIHGEILATLGRLWAASPSREQLVEAVGLHRAIDDLEKTWDKVDRLQTLLARDVGTIVWMEGKGVGRVVESNVELESFKVDFERHPGLMVGFRAAGKLMEPLPAGHFLRRKLEEPEALRELAEREPAALLEAVLTSYGRPLTAAEVKDAVAGIVPENRWVTWWGRARKHPQVLTGAHGRQTYRWAATAEDATARVWSSFEKANPRHRAQIFLKNAGRGSELRERMAAALASAAAAADADPALAFELWSSLARAGATAPGDSPARRLVAAASPARLLGGLEDRAVREEALHLVREVRPDWPAIFTERLSREDDPRLLDFLVAAAQGENPGGVARFLDGVLAGPRKHPAAFTWLAERAAEDEELRRRHPLRLLQHLLAGLTAPGFEAFRSRLRALVEPGSTVPRLLAELTAEQAAAAAQAIQKASGLEGYQRTPLLNALQTRFPQLRSEEETPLYATPVAIARRREELRHLLEEEIPANRRAIEEARAHGDLRENFEYKAARQRHEYLSARVAGLERDLSRARPIDPARHDAGEIRVGSRVTLEGPAGHRRLTILGPWESLPEEDVISYDSDLGRELLGKKAGDEVEIGGARYAVAAIEPYG
jgi:transcription elongation GreA/GreB family factor